MNTKSATNDTAHNSRTRRLKWRRSHSRAMAVGACICLLSILVVLTTTWWQGRQAIVLQHTTKTTHAVVARRWTENVAGKTEYWIAYRYPELPAEHPDAHKQVSALWWSVMNPGSAIAIQYTPADPDVNGFAGNESHLFRRWLWSCGLFGVLMAIAPLWIYLGSIRRKRRDLNLLRTGRPATAEIVNVIETMQSHGNRQKWDYEVSYRFALPDGTYHLGERRETSATPLPWEVGQVMTAFYDSEMPERHALYLDLPGELVSVVG